MLMLAKREIPSNVINYDMCKICPNPCCLYMPCEYLPSDFVEPKMDAIEQVILNNLAIIDSKFLDFENKFIYYLRARTIYEDLNTMDCLGKKDIYHFYYLYPYYLDFLDLFSFANNKTFYFYHYSKNLHL